MFYFVHLQFLFLFAGAVLWLELTRLRRPTTLLLALSAALPALAMAVGHRLMAPAVFHLRQQQMITDSANLHPPGSKISMSAGYMFGAHHHQHEWLLLALYVALGFLLVAHRNGSAKLLPRDWLFGARFGTLAGWIALLYFILPNTFVGTFVFQRLAALALMFVALVVFPAPLRSRAPYAKALVACAFGLQLVLASGSALVFDKDMEGLK